MTEFTFKTDIQACFSILKSHGDFYMEYFFLVMHRYFKIFHHFFIFCEYSLYKMILLIQ